MKILSINKVGDILKVESEDFMYERAGSISNFTFKDGLAKWKVDNIRNWVNHLENSLDKV